jgi:aspartate/methionine/tyrosine aminotransferase
VSLRPARRIEGLERTLIRRLFDSAPPDAINLGLGQPDLPTPPPAALAGIAGVVRGFTAYTTTAGIEPLRRAVASRYGGAVAGAQGVAITVGSQEAMYACMLALVDPGEEVLHPDPGYPAYAMVARLVGAEPTAYPLRAERGFRPRAEDVLARVGPRTRLVVLCGPSNPTGACMPRGELERLVRALGERGVPWLSDEVYSAFVYDRDFVSAIELAPEGGLVISGLSKELSMTGWRVGWVAGPPAIVERIVAVHQYLVTCAPSVSQQAALAAFGEEGQRARRAYLATFRARRELMARELGRIGGLRVEPPDGAFYFFVDVSRWGESAKLAERLLARRRVIVIPGEAFGPGGRGYLRISFAASEDAIRRGIEALGRELES